MAEITLTESAVRVRLRGWRKLLTIMSGFDIPLSSIRHVSIGSPGLPQFAWKDRRVGGSSIPGHFAMGRFRMGSPPRRAFLELKASSREVLRLDLNGFAYDFVLVEVDDARRAVDLIDGARGERSETAAL